MFIFLHFPLLFNTELAKQVERDDGLLSMWHQTCVMLCLDTRKAKKLLCEGNHENQQSCSLVPKEAHTVLFNPKKTDSRRMG